MNKAKAFSFILLLMTCICKSVKKNDHTVICTVQNNWAVVSVLLRILMIYVIFFFGTLACWKPYLWDDHLCFLWLNCLFHVKKNIYFLMVFVLFCLSTHNTIYSAWLVILASGWTLRRRWQFCGSDRRPREPYHNHRNYGMCISNSNELER